MDMEKSRLNWKLKISNTADNAGINKSQAHGTRHRRMQEINSLCTDSKPLRAEYCIVTFHIIHPSSLILHLTVSYKWKNHEYKLIEPNNKTKTPCRTYIAINRFI